MGAAEDHRELTSPSSLPFALPFVALELIISCRSQTALSFLNTQALSVHGLVRPSSIFVTESGEWRLGGLDLLSSTRPTELETGVLWNMGGVVAGREGVSPEVIKEGWTILKT